MIGRSNPQEKVQAMFPKWRLTLRKAEHALKTGHLNEACQLATAPEVHSFRPARDLAGRIARALAERAEKHLEADEPGF